MDWSSRETGDGLRFLKQESPANRAERWRG